MKPKRTAIPLTEQQIQIPGYKIISNLSKEEGRGIVLYIRDTFQVRNINIESDYEPYLEQVWISINLPGEPIQIGTIYRSPSSPNLERSLFEVVKSIDRKVALTGNLLIVGDFNLPSVQWIDGCGYSGQKSVVPFLECLANYSLYQAVNFPTRYRDGHPPSLLDLVIVNDHEALLNVAPLPPFGASDHAAIRCSLRLYPEKSVFTKHVYRDYRLMKQELAGQDWSFITENDVDKSWNMMKKILLEVSEKNTAVRWARKPKTLPFMTKELKRARNKKKRYWRLYKQNIHNKNHYTKYTKTRNQVRNLSRKLFEQHEEAVAAASKLNPKRFWNYASARKPGRHSVTRLKDNDRIIDDPIEIANAVNRQFTSVFTPPDNAPLPDPPTYTIITPMPPITVNRVDVEARLKKLNPNKSVGPDGVHPRLLKELHVELSGPLTHLFQKSLDEKCISQDWRMAHITPIHKGGSKEDASNYRPISVTSAVGKLLEAIVNTAILKHLTTNKLFSSCQHGFRSGRSVETNLIDSYNYITDLLDQGFPVDIILLDLAKAFDKVCHKRLRIKLQAIGVSGGVVEWVMQFLTDRKQTVKVFGEDGRTFFSEVAAVGSGVPQGTVLGPTLFNIYINDVPKILNNKVSLYADDSKLIGRADTAENIKSIQLDLDTFTHWTNIWRLEFNASKCKTLHLGKKNPHTQYHMDCRDGSRNAISSSHAERDLGVLVDDELKFHIHAQATIAKANQTLGLIKRTFTSRSPTVMTKLYKSLVRPRLEFGMCIACPINKTDQAALESVQRRATKCIRDLYDVPYPSRLRKLRIPSLTYRRKRGDVITAYKLLNAEDTIPGLFQPDNSNRTRGHSQKLFRKRANTRLRNKFFSNRVVSLWNSLSEKTVTSTSVDAFKSSVDREWLNKPWCTIWDATNDD